MTTPFTQPDVPNPIHCCVCLNSADSKRVSATWQTKTNYFVCDDHKDVNVLQMIETVWGRKRAT